jgi:hypothetical protein
MFRPFLAGCAMTRRAGLLVVSLAVVCGGCGQGSLSSLWPDAPLGGVPDRPFAAAPSGPVGPVPTFKQAPATEAAARRVNEVAQRILAANADLPVKPLILAVGRPEPEIFHQDTAALYISEGLVSQCATEAQLAAVLCNELGKMVSTRQALLALKAHRPDRRPPPTVAIGNDGGGGFGPADATYRAEQLKFEEQTGKAGGALSPPPDPQLLARTFLKRAGFEPTDLDAVAPLLREAEKHSDIETQITAPIRPFVGQ